MKVFLAENKDLVFVKVLRTCEGFFLQGTKIWCL